MTSRSSEFNEFAENDGERQDVARIWSFLKRADEERASTYDVDAEWTRLANRLDLENTSDAARPEARREADRPPASRSRTPHGRIWLKALSMAILVLGVAVGGLWYWSQPVSISTSPGERSTVSLPDGSTVTLNGSTTLTHDRGFRTLAGLPSGVRQVHLDGEAFFSVVEGDRPFRVNTANAQVEVLGTEFNVHARLEGDRSETAVTLASGRVRLGSRANDSTGLEGSVVLDDRGETSRVDGMTEPSAPRSVELKYVHAWRKGGFAISGAKLSTVLRELEHRFGTRLQLGDASAATDTMTLHYAPETELKDILRDICLIQNLSYRETSQGYELVADPQ